MTNITWEIVGVLIAVTTLPLATSLLLAHVFVDSPARIHGCLVAGIVVALVAPGLGIYLYPRPDVAPRASNLSEEKAVELHPSQSSTAFSSTFMEIPESPPNSLHNIPQVVATIILLGTFIMILRLGIYFILGMCLLRRAEPMADGPLYAILKKVQKRSGPLPVLFSTVSIASPAIWCWGLRPSLLIPVRAVGSREPGIWTSVFEHELAHLRRWDNVWTMCSEFALCFLYWNPLIYAVRRELLESADIACDDEAVKSVGDPASYADALLSFAVQRSPLNTLALVSDADALKRRIHRIVSEERKMKPAISFPRLTVSTLLLVGCSGFLFALADSEKVTPFPNQEGNLIQNSGFETGEDGPDSWEQGKPVAGVSQTWLQESGLNGSACIRFEKTAARYFPIARWHQQVMTPIPTDVTLVELAGYARCKDLTKAVMDVEFLDANGSWTHKWAVYLGPAEDSELPWTHDWKRYTGQVELPPGTVSVRLSLQQYGPGRVDFDEVGLRFLSAPKTLVE